MKYWKVEAKCGHVGRNKYLIKPFFVKAKTSKEAAEDVRWSGRVKHHKRDAIRSVKEVNEKTYLIGIKANREDPYFNAKNIQEQRATCIGIENEILYEEKPVVYKKHTHERIHLIEKLLINEWKKERGYCFNE